MLLLLSVSTSSLVASKESFQRNGHQKSPRRRIETRTQQPLSSNCSRPHLRKRFFASSHAALVAASQHSDLSSLDRGPFEEQRRLRDAGSDLAFGHLPQQADVRPANRLAAGMWQMLSRRLRCRETQVGMRGRTQGAQKVC